MIRNGDLNVRKGKATIPVRPLYAKTKSRLYEILTRTRDFGRGQVQDELKRQSGE